MLDYQEKTTSFKHQRDIFNVTKDLKAYGLFWEQGCVDGETEFLSPKGWTPISQYAGGLVAQWEYDQGTASFVQPTRYIDEPCSEMIHIKTKYGMDQMLSLDHRVLHISKSSGKIVEDTAEKIQQDLKKPSAFRVVPSTFRMPFNGEGWKLTDVEIRLMVAVLADGSFPAQAPRTKRVEIRVKKQRKKDRLVWLLEQSGRDYSRVDRPDGFTVFAFNAPMRVKRWPLLLNIHAMENLSDKQAQIILDEVWSWDGSGTTYCSKYKEDVEFIQLLAARSGYRCSICEGSTWEARIAKGGEPYSFQGKNINRVAATRKYCFQVPSGGLVLRRHGQIFLTGNCGKTKPCIDKCCYLFQNGKIEAMLVFAPNGVHRNWANDEIPTHMPDLFRDKALVHVFSSGNAGTLKAKRAREQLLKHQGGLRVLCISYSGLKTKVGKAFVRRFLTKFKCLAIADESQMFKTRATGVAEAMIAEGRYAEYKVILSGTPITQGAFDVFPQIMFLDENFWKERGLHPYGVFKNHFGVYVRAEDYNRESQQMAAEIGFSRQERKYDQLVDYKNQEELKGYLKLITHRLTKDSAGIVLPPKVYTKRYFDLTPKQMAVYRELESEFIAELPDTGEWIEAPEVIVRLLRLQQITAGYVATQAEEPEQPIDGKFPRLDLLCETLENTEGKAIIWSRFTPDVDLIMARLTKMGRNPVRYDGQVSEDQRERNKRAFQFGDATDFVGKPQSGATGLTLHAAKSVHYYTNSYNYGHRAQSEDRAHRIGLKHSVLYVDYIANGTKDMDIVRNLRKKLAFASELLGDAPRETL